MKSAIHTALSVTRLSQLGLGSAVGLSSQATGHRGAAAVCCLSRMLRRRRVALMLPHHWDHKPLGELKLGISTARQTAGQKIRISQCHRPVRCLYLYLTFLLPAEKIKQATQLLRAAHAGSLALCSQCYGALPRFPAQQPDCYLDAKCACDD